MPFFPRYPKPKASLDNDADSVAGVVASTSSSKHRPSVTGSEIFSVSSRSQLPISGVPRSQFIQPEIRSSSSSRNANDVPSASVPTSRASSPQDGAEKQLKASAPEAKQRRTSNTSAVQKQFPYSSKLSASPSDPQKLLSQAASILVSPTIDPESDRLARACGQLPLSLGVGIPCTRQRSASCNIPLDYLSTATEQDVDTYLDARSDSRGRAQTMRLPSSRRDMHVDLYTQRGRMLIRSQNQARLHPPPFIPADPYQTLLEFDRLCIEVQDQQAHRFFDMDLFLQMKRKEAEEMRQYELLADEGKRRVNGQSTLYGVSLEDALLWSSVTTIMGGVSHQIPTVVYACVEELYRTGIYQQNIFRALPNRTRLVELTRIFDETPHPDTTLLRKASMPDTCAVLTTYIKALPEPLIYGEIYEALWISCVYPDILSDSDSSAVQLQMPQDEPVVDFKKWQGRRRHSDPPTLAEEQEQERQEERQEERHQDVVDPKDHPRVKMARAVLRLANPKALSLMAYLFAFFTQIPLCPENGMMFSDLSRIFASSILGGREKQVTWLIMTWLLENWGAISEKMFVNNLPQDTGPVRASPVFRAPLLPKEWERPSIANGAEQSPCAAPRTDSSTTLRPPPSHSQPHTGRPHSHSISSDSTFSSECSEPSEAVAQQLYTYDIHNTHNNMSYDTGSRKLGERRGDEVPERWSPRSASVGLGLLHEPALYACDYLRSEPYIGSDDPMPAYEDNGESSDPTGDDAVEVLREAPASMLMKRELSSASMRISELEKRLKDAFRGDTSSKATVDGGHDTPRSEARGKRRGFH